jgi:two-component system phosphate regulon sensor histidine kinase PhoR
VRLSARKGDGEVALLVNDDGPGIPPTHLPRLFERFYRVDKGRSREVGGTGLGLSIVKHLVDALGGRVTVDSEVGRGSTFTVHLPSAPAPDRELPAAPATREDDAGIPHQP